MRIIRKMKNPKRHLLKNWISDLETTGDLTKGQI